MSYVCEYMLFIFNSSVVVHDDKKIIPTEFIPY